MATRDDVEMMLPGDRHADAIVDVMRVPLAGDPALAVVRVAQQKPVRDIDCEVLVVGGGTGGVAAALAAARRGRNVCLLEETDWLGGQFTAQGVSALDEHEHIEAFGGTASYTALRAALREHYRALAANGAGEPEFNPGNCWVTRLAFEPAVAVAVLNTLLQPQVAAGRLQVHLRTKATGATVAGERIASVCAVDLERGESIRFHPQVVLDATELGDLLPLVGAEYRIGAETAEETGEPNAQPHAPKPHCVQSFTYTFGLERRPEGESHVVPAPPGYAAWHAANRYSLRIEVHGGEIYGEDSGWLAFSVFDTLPGTKGSLWTYRRLIDSAQFGGRYPCDLSMINWPGNDYGDSGLVDRPAHEVAAALQQAKRASLGFLHWLQTAAPATGTRLGAPELRLVPSIMGSADGLSKHPYIREGRRIRALTTVREQDVSMHSQPGPRARHFDDSVGVGWYPIDIHRAGAEDVGVSTRTHPFQIPLGALLPARIDNLIAAGKNIGTTHITNGCYRLHPVEWNIGEAAGALAAFTLEQRCSPRAVHGTPELLRQFQATLADDGVPLAWLIDVGVRDPAFAAVQRLAMSGRLRLGDDLLFHPAAAMACNEWERWGGSGSPPPDRAAAATRLAGSAGAGPLPIS
ncbi:MAG: FAD-dependent oxidoreductase [Burkholderiales bacterium]|nr:FAD-dependent oxidoreductase [Burkholderiales bacterium]